MRQRLYQTRIRNNEFICYVEVNADEILGVIIS